MALAVAESPRWELYRLLGEPSRLRLLGLTSEDELSIGELADLAGEAQPNVSKHLKQLREAGLVVVRRQGTRALARLAPHLGDDPLLLDAIAAGRKLCTEEGSLGRVADVIGARDEQTRAFFARPADDSPNPIVADWAAYLTALRLLLPRRALAVDIGTGDGALVELLAPLFDRVIAVDRSEERLKHAQQRLSSARYDNVELVQADYQDGSVACRAQELGGADVVLAVRLLHHAPRPKQAVAHLASFARLGGRVLIIDYLAHNDEHMREKQADLWLGFEPAELTAFATSAGLIDPEVSVIPAARYGSGPDAHLQWQVLAAQRDPDEETRPS
ncbi:MAG: metalloregulator ArsR/SmtB family transcription factor [Polyangiales bacterium]